MLPRDFTLDGQTLTPGSDSLFKASTFAAVVEIIALAKLCLASAFLLSANGLVAIGDYWLFALNIAAFAGVGVFLRLCGKHDRRAVALAIFLLLIATTYADPPLAEIAAGASVFAPAAFLLRHMQIVAFSPYFFWLFIRDFPRPRTYCQPRMTQRGLRVALFAGGALATAHLLAIGMPSDRVAMWLARLVDRGRLDSLHWPVIICVGFTAIPHAVWQAQHASPDERRRVRLLIAGLLFGLAPELLLTLAGSVWPALVRYADSPSGRPVILAIVTPPQLVAPFIVAYSVLVQKALDVRLIARKILQYILARNLLAVILFLPFGYFVATVYVNRHTPLSNLWVGATGLSLTAALAATGFAIQLRSPMAALLDRLFFREQYDSRRLLANLASNIREAMSAANLTQTLAEEIGNALHLSFTDVLLLTSDRSNFATHYRSLTPLSRTSRIASWLEDSAKPLDVSWESSHYWIGSLTDHDRQWLVDSDVRLLVPLISTSGALLGVICMGEKLSELPFSKEDKELVTAIAGSAAFAVEFRILPTSRLSSDGMIFVGTARECLGCGAVVATELRRCECGEPTVSAPVPLLLGDKFRFLQRIGHGGMGVVYRALDLTLDREVAIKSLPRVSAIAARRLRSEARAMAAVSHPNLATILGTESYEGMPLLIVELLAGTLDSELYKGPLSLAEVIALSTALSDALCKLHSSGILHRDIKPSNIGFTREGTPKLLDFGLARMIEVAQAADTQGAPRSLAGYNFTMPSAMASTTVASLAGTPLYFSPEAAKGEPPSRSMDLWALSIVLYQSFAGLHPLEIGPGHMVERLVAPNIPDIREYVPTANSSVADFFRNALHADPAKRPSSAAELGRLVQRLQHSE